MPPQLLDQIRIVLVETSHPGNIGAAARAMKTMGLWDLALVQPQNYPCVEATARAAGADDVLARTQVYETLADAISDCSLVFGTSARSRRTLQWPIVAPRDAVKQIARDQGATAKTAIVFGRERSGLTNEELMSCHTLINIPVNPDYSSLNLAAAVQVMAYELRLRELAGLADDGPEANIAEEPATAEMMEGLYTHLFDTMVESGYTDPDNPRHLNARLRRLFGKARLSVNEINILRGFLKACSKVVSKKKTNSNSG